MSSSTSQPRFRVHDLGNIIRRTYQHRFFNEKCLSLIIQEETFYKPKNKDLQEIVLSKSSSDNGSKLVIRRKIPDVNNNHRSIVGIKSYNQMKSILSCIGTELGVIEKTRLKFKFSYVFRLPNSKKIVQDVFIFIDTINRLGDFIEFKCSTIHEGNIRIKEIYSKTISELTEFYGLSKNDEIKESYIDLLEKLTKSQKEGMISPSNSTILLSNTDICNSFVSIDDEDEDEISSEDSLI